MRYWKGRRPLRGVCIVGVALITWAILMGCEQKGKSTPPSAQEETQVGAAGEKGRETTPTKVKKPAPEASVSPVPEQADQKAIPGIAFSEKLTELLRHELEGRAFGWRPNDVVIGRITDNMSEFQLGSLEAIRFTAVKLKETLTRFGDADAYDPHLINAVNLLMNRSDQFWFPSTESQYKLALEELQAFIANLRQGKSRFFYRTDNLLSLIAAYKDLLGNCHENLVKDKEADGTRVSFFQADNYFYYAQGVAHVMCEMLKVVRVGFAEQLRTIDAVALTEKILEDLQRAVKYSPLIITNSDGSGILANHRYNLAAPISSALHNMSSMLRY